MKANLYAGMLYLLISSPVCAQELASLVHAVKDQINSPRPLASQSLPSSAGLAKKKIDLNQAEFSEIIHSVKGIGEKRAAAIISYRQTHGAFKSIWELSLVPGLGGGFVEKHHAELEQVFKIG